MSAAASVADPHLTLEEQALRSDEERTLHALIAQLTPEQAHILELRLAGLTDVDIARVLGMRRRAVRAAQHRAVLRLRKLLGVGATGEHDD